jgi:hypothetical protein
MDWATILLDIFLGRNSNVGPRSKVLLRDFCSSSIVSLHSIKVVETDTSARSYTTDNQLSPACKGFESKMNVLRAKHLTLRKEYDDNETIKDPSYIVYFERSP